MSPLTVETECIACDGTGLYVGLAEPKGTAVVCLRCSGTGCREITYTPFTSRKPRRGIQTVMLSRGTLILSCGPAGEAISYEEFTAGKMPSSETAKGARP